jgi:cytoskeletal protein RodZ
MDQLASLTYTPIDIDSLGKRKTNKKLFIILGAIILILLIGSIGFLSLQSHKARASNIITPTTKPTETPSASPSATTSPTSKPSPKITSALDSPTPTETPTPTPTSGPVVTPIPPDTEPPQTHIYYPDENGQLTFETNGQVCATATIPTDNRSPGNKIQTQYAFDGDEYNNFAFSVAYLCKPTLANGTHVLKYRSKDEAGNVEPEQIRHFIVNIPTNTRSDIDN